MKTVCMDCGLLLGEIRDGTDKTSHGLCWDCFRTRHDPDGEMTAELLWPDEFEEAMINSGIYEEEAERTEVDDEEVPD